MSPTKDLSASELPNHISWDPVIVVKLPQLRNLTTADRLERWLER